jgi:hypothetical protein
MELVLYVDVSFLAYFPILKKLSRLMRSRCCLCVCILRSLSLLGNGSVKVPLTLLRNGLVKIPLSLLGNGSVKIPLLLLGDGSVKKPLVVARQRLGKIPCRC